MTSPLSPSWTPVAAFLRLRARPYPFFLDSGGGSPALARHSFVGSDPFLVVHGTGRRARLEYPREGKTVEVDEHPFVLLRRLLDEYAASSDGEPLSTGGAVGYLSYDLFSQIEALQRTARDDLGMPDWFFGFYDALVRFDHQTGQGEWIRRPTGRHPEPPEALFSLLEGVPGELAVPPAPAQLAQALPTPNQTPEAFREAVRKAKEHIAAGDVYQVNLSQRFATPYTGDPVDFYLRLRSVSPAPFGGCLFPDGFSILSNSPERYLLIDGDTIETRPIKGTRPRGRDAQEDARLARELAQSVKDGAEHVMIVDLERNDLGRVCAYHSVHVPEFKVIESYANVHHMVSTVAGRIHPSRDVVDCIRNSFPGGSITGAPKVWALRIIDQLEPTARGIYCGSMGYIDFAGRVDLNIAIRTAVHCRDTLYFQVGGGIVADSDPEEEYQETLTKAQSFLRALTGKGRTWNG